VTLDAPVENAIVKSLPALRGFAISLCRNRDRADELVQETVRRAIEHIDTFESGSNLDAWLITILRNHFYSECRKSKWVEEDIDGRRASSMEIPPDQVGWDVAEDLRAGLGRLSRIHQQALFLVGASGLSYREAAEVAGCDIGTMKSRVSRARRILAALMSGKGAAPRRYIGRPLSGQARQISDRRDARHASPI